MTQAESIRRIREECEKQGISLKKQVNYIIATVAWETNHTFMPVREAYWLSENWREENLSYYPYYGRGFVQITGIDNYRKYEKILRLDLVNNPDLALDFDVSVFILVHGFKHGLFTGLKISDFISERSADYEGARKCINGTDKAMEIAMIARNIKQTSYA